MDEKKITKAEYDKVVMEVMKREIKEEGSNG